MMGNWKINSIKLIIINVMIIKIILPVLSDLQIDIIFIPNVPWFLYILSSAINTFKSHTTNITATKLMRSIDCIPHYKGNDY